MGKFLIAIKSLEKWFNRQKRILPWRDLPTPYRVWISEIMLQQTQVVTVVPYFQRFMDKFPTVEALASAQLDDVLLLWAGLGYYSRARNLHQGAKKIVETKRFPQTREEWLEIPGVGPYTAGAILSISADMPVPILDGNIERVLSRVRCVDRNKGDAAFKSRLWKLSEIFVTTAHSLPSAIHSAIRPSILNQALMELGATVCTPQSPQCPKCPLAALCRAHARRQETSYPPPKKRREWVRLEEKMHCILNEKGEVLLRKQAEGKWRSGLWDLLENVEELGKLEHLGSVETKHTLTHHKIKRRTEVWKVVTPNKKQNPSGAQVLKAAEPERFSTELLQWVPLHSPSLALGSAAKRTLERVKETY